jgi:hypothetical protein
MRAITGEIIALEAKAYVVRGMTVPILLGEDFQLSYELGVSRNVETGSKIWWKDLPYEVEASGVEPYVGRAEVRKLASGLTIHARSLTKAKKHRRDKARRQRKALRNGANEKVIRASQDYRIRAHECKLVRVDGDLNEDKEWLVKRNLLANAEDSFFSVPNTLISARWPTIPVSNMSDQPHMIRKGEILGTLKDPQSYFDAPKTVSEWNIMEARTALLAKVIDARAKQDAGDGPREREPQKEDVEVRIWTDFESGVPRMKITAKMGSTYVTSQDECWTARDS